jgi:hypothetical protein
VRGRIFLLLCASAACLHAQGEDLLRRATAKVMETVGRLPKYLCTQTIEREQKEPPPGSAGRNCEPSKRRQLALTTSDRLRLDVAMTGSREMYSWVGEGFFDNRSLFDVVKTGAMSTGAFSSFLRVVFRDDEARFSYKGETTEGGKKLTEFAFSVPQQLSHYTFTGGSSVITGYSGSIFVDSETAELARLIVQTDNLPLATGACEGRTTLNYSRVRLNDADFLLPNRVDLHIQNSDGVEMDNHTVYTGCHEYLGESTLRFDDPSDAAAAGGDKDAALKDFPPALNFLVRFPDPIDSAVAAAGDPLHGILAEPIRDSSGTILSPVGAAVTARILQIRRFYVHEPMIRLKFKLESVEVAGEQRKLNAVSLFYTPPAVKGKLSQRSENGVWPDNEFGEAARLETWKPEKALIPPFESKWVTADPSRK